MVQSRDESSPSRSELVVLACLSQSRPPSDAELGDAVQQLASPREPAEIARQRAVELLAGLVRRAWVTGGDEAPWRGRSWPGGVPTSYAIVASRPPKDHLQCAA